MIPSSKTQKKTVKAAKTVTRKIAKKSKAAEWMDTKRAFAKRLQKLVRICKRVETTKASYANAKELRSWIAITQ